MGTSSGAGRALAAAIALVCWIGLAVQFNAIMEQGQSAAGALWIMARYFTILTNLIVAVVFTGLALGNRAFASPTWAQLWYSWRTLATLRSLPSSVHVLRSPCRPDCAAASSALSRFLSQSGGSL